MQRVGIELLRQFEDRSDMEVSAFLLRTAGWRHYVQFHPWFLSSLFRIQKIIERGQADAVLFSAMPSAVMAVQLGSAAKRAGIPLLAIAHGHDVIVGNFLYQRLLRRVFANLSGVLAVSRATGSACSSRGLDAAALFITPNGIDPNRFREEVPFPKTNDSDRRAVLRQSFPDLVPKLPPGALVLCSVGRQVKRKGHEWFVRSVMPLLESNVHLVLGGQGPEVKRISQAVDEVGMAERVHALGVVPEEKLAAFYRYADLFIMPNVPVQGDMEGFGIVMLEAGLCGLPTIASRIEGIQDVITEGVNGFTVASKDARGFAEQVNQFAKNRALLEPLSLSARTHTLESFSWSVVADGIVATIRENIARTRAPG